MSATATVEAEEMGVGMVTEALACVLVGSGLLQEAGGSIFVWAVVSVWADGNSPV